MKILVFVNMNEIDFKLPDLPEGGVYRNVGAYHEGDSVENCDMWCGDAPQAYRDKYDEYKPKQKRKTRAKKEVEPETVEADE